MSFFEVIFGDGRWVYLWHGLEVTLVLTVLSLLLGFVIGVVIALMRVSEFRPFAGLRCYPRLRWLADFNPLASFARLYVEIVRGTPLLVQLLIMYYVVFGSYRFMPKIFVAAIAFGVNSGAYVAEIIRGGIESVEAGQFEAARSLGLSYQQTMRFIILPQAFKNSLPALTGESVALLKETSVVGWIGLGDIMRGADDIRSLTATAFQSLLAAAVMYLILTVAFTKVMRRVERGLGRD